jgi:hypothetical protein
MRSRYKVPTMIGTAVLAIALAGCGGSSDAASEGQGAGGGQAGGAPITITEPQNGANVQVPFTVRYETAEELGPEESGRNHVHFLFDGSDEYQVVTANEYEITNLSPGRHTIKVTLQRADHSPVGPETEFTVNVTGGGGSGGQPGGGGGGSDYDYGGGGY